MRWYLREVSGESAYDRYVEHRRREHPGRAGDVAARLRAPPPGRARGPAAGSLLLKLGRRRRSSAIERERWSELGGGGDRARLRRARRAERPRRARRASTRSPTSTCRSRGCSSCGSTRRASSRAAQGAFLGETPHAVPFLIALGGSVAVGKSHGRAADRPAAAVAAPGVARRARDHRRLPAAQRDADRARHPRPQGLPGELRPARAAALRRRPQERRRRGPRARSTRTCATTSSTDETQVVRAPDVRRAGGRQRAPARAAGASTCPTSSTSRSTSTRDEDDVQRWYLERFLALRNGAFQDPESYFHRYAQLSDEEAVAVAAGHLGAHEPPEPAREHPAHAPARGPDPREGPRPLRVADPAAARVESRSGLRLAGDRLRVRRQRQRAAARAEGLPGRRARVRAALRRRRAAEVHLGRAALLVRAAAGAERDLPADDLQGRRDRVRAPASAAGRSATRTRSTARPPASTRTRSGRR